MFLIEIFVIALSFSIPYITLIDLPQLKVAQFKERNNE